MDKNIKFLITILLVIVIASISWNVHTTAVKETFAETMGCEYKTDTGKHDAYFKPTYKYQGTGSYYFIRGEYSHADAIIAVSEKEYKDSVIGEIRGYDGRTVYFFEDRGWDKPI